MQKISDSTNTANPAGEFTEGNPAAGAPATLLKAPWLNTIQRELENLVRGSGQDLTPADDEQVLKAVKMLQELASTWENITGKPTTRDGYKLSDVFTETETGTAIQNAIAALVASSPAALDTLKELADALGNDPNFAATMTNALAGKASKATTLGGYGITDAFTKPETTTAIQQAVAALVASSPEALDTLKELAEALGNDPNFAATMTNALAGKQSALGFTPVQQGGGVDQGPNSIKIGWSGGGLKATVDATDLGAFWLSSNFNPSDYVAKSELPLGFGVSQEWQDVTGSRSLNVVYTNPTARLMALNITTILGQSGVLNIFVRGELLFTQTVNNALAGATITGFALVPPGATFQVTAVGYTIAKWQEFR